MGEWKKIKLGDLIKLASGKFNPTKNLDNSYKYPTYGGNGITGKSKDYLIDFETLIIGRVGAYCGSIYHTDERIWITDNAMYIKESSDKINLKFLSYFLHSINLHRFASQSGQPKLTQKPIETLEINLPPLPIQKQIVSILEKAENLKQKREETNKETQKIIQSLFYEMFGDPVKNEKGWDEDKFENVCKNLFAGGDVPKDNFSKEESKEYEIPIYSNGTGDKAFYGFTNIEKVQEDSVTISARGTIGYPVIRKAPFYPIIRLVVATPDTSKVNIEYFKEAISFFKFDKGGTSIPQLTVPMIKNNKMLIPPLPIQEEFAKKVQLIESIQSKQQSSTEEINTLFDALMQKAFKGELVE
jgi:restriction endonuclease S subunit